MYQLYGSVSDSINIILQLIAGTFVNGPYALITTAGTVSQSLQSFSYQILFLFLVSAELGTKVPNSHALATVTAIIDGTGSIGSSKQQFFLMTKMNELYV